MERREDGETRRAPGPFWVLAERWQKPTFISFKLADLGPAEHLQTDVLT